MIVIKFSNNNFTSKILSYKPLVFIGLISYSLYLWHYPIFSFSELLSFQSSSANKLFIILLSLFLSIISYYLIEKKFRNKSLINNKFFSIYLIFAILFISFFSYFINKENGYSNRGHVIFSEDFDQKPWEILKNNNDICHLRVNNFCDINPNGKKSSVFLVGDSHLITMGKPLSDNLIEKDFNFVSLTNGGCYFFPNFNYVNKKTNEVLFGCDTKYQNKRLNLILSKENSIVIIGGNLNKYLINKDVNNIESPFIFKNNDSISLEKDLISSIYDLLNKGVKVILIYPIPEIPWDPLNKIFDSSNSRNLNEVKDYILKNKVSTSFNDYIQRSKKSFGVLNQINHKNLFKIFPHLIFCTDNNGKNCPIHDKKNIFYFDSEHLSITGANMLQEEVFKIIDNLDF